jgi:hypothetical protein
MEKAAWSLIGKGIGLAACFLQPRFSKIGKWF